MFFRGAPHTFFDGRDPLFRRAPKFVAPPGSQKPPRALSFVLKGPKTLPPFGKGS